MGYKHPLYIYNYMSRGCLLFDNLFVIVFCGIGSLYMAFAV